MRLVGPACREHGDMARSANEMGASVTLSATEFCWINVSPQDQTADKPRVETSTQKQYNQWKKNETVEKAFPKSL